MVSSVAVHGQICKWFLAVDGETLAVDGQKVAVTFQRFCGFEAFPLSYIKRNLEGGLIHARRARIKALARAGVGKSHSCRSKNGRRWTVGKNEIARARERAGRRIIAKPTNSIQRAHGQVDVLTTLS